MFSGSLDENPGFSGLSLKWDRFSAWISKVSQCHTDEERILLGLIHLLATILTSYTMYANNPPLHFGVGEAFIHKKKKRKGRHQHSRNSFFSEQVADGSHAVTGANKDIYNSQLCYSALSQCKRRRFRRRRPTVVVVCWSWRRLKINSVHVTYILGKREAVTPARCLRVTFLTESATSQKKVGRTKQYIH